MSYSISSQYTEVRNRFSIDSKEITMFIRSWLLLTTIHSNFFSPKFSFKSILTCFSNNHFDTISSVADLHLCGEIAAVNLIKVSKLVKSGTCSNDINYFMFLSNVKTLPYFLQLQSFTLSNTFRISVKWHFERRCWDDQDNYILGNWLSLVIISVWLSSTSQLVVRKM